MGDIIGTSFAQSGFAYDANLSPFNRNFSAAVRAVMYASGYPGPTGTGLPAGAFGNPSVKVSSTATNGTSSVAMRADAAPALDFAMDPVNWTGLHSFLNQTLAVDNQLGSAQCRVNINSGTTFPAYVQLGVQGAVKGRLGALGTSSDLGVPIGLINDMVFTALGTAARIILQAPSGVVLAGTGFMLRMTTYQGTSSQSYQDWFTGTTRRGFFGYGNSADDTMILANEVANSPISLRMGGVEHLRLGTATSATGIVLQVRGFTAGGFVDLSPDTGSFNGTMTGATTSPVSAMVWSRNGNQVMLTVGTVSGSSNVTNFSLGQLPAEISPARAQGGAVAPAGAHDNSANANATWTIGAAGVNITFLLNDSSSGWTAAGTKGIFRQFTICYMTN